MTIADGGVEHAVRTELQAPATVALPAGEGKDDLKRFVGVQFEPGDAGLAADGGEEHVHQVVFGEPR